MAKYDHWLQPENLLRVQAWARNGLIDDQIAANMGITRATFYEWKKKYIDFSDALKRGKEVIDIQVENALLKRALGFEYTEVKEEDDGDNIKTTRTTKLITPDTTAQIFWLKNRKPIEWRDKHDIEHSGGIDTEVNIVIGGKDYAED